MLNQLTLIRAVEEFLATPPYEACLLVVSPDIATLTAAQKLLKTDRRLTPFSVGKTLAAGLMDHPAAERPRRVRAVFQTAIRQQGKQPLLCTDVDLIFHPDLHQDPLRLFRDAGRKLPLIVLWPGTFASDTLAYAVGEHAHYRTWAHPDLCANCIIPL